MRLSSQLSLILLAGFVVAIVAAGFAGRFVGGVVPLAVFAMLSAVNVFFVWRVTWKWLWRRAFARVRRAFADEDARRAERLLDRLAPQAPTRQLRTSIAINRAMVPILDERWHDAVIALRAVVLGTFDEHWRISYDNALAWALTHDGALDEAVGLARATVERARADARLPAESRAACIGTLGVALVRAGMLEPGLQHLREAIAAGGMPRHQSVRHLYMGDAERGLGHDAAAEAAYREAARLAPDSPVGKRAAERLKSAPPVPYR